MINRIKDYLELVKFQHTVFALPFALTSAVAATRQVPPLRTMGWILVAMVGARTAAMGFNRIADRKIDALNPRTKAREIPSGKVSVLQAGTLVALASVLFIFAAWQLNRLAFVLSFPTLFILLGYSFTKRFTALSHLALGLCLGIAPIGAWVAVRGSIDLPPLLLGAGVMFWVAGFDIIYATLDYDFDRGLGLHSFVTRFGISGALSWSRVFHVLFCLSLIAFGITAQLGVPFHLGAVLIAGFLVYEHSLFSPKDLRRVNVAFFAVNGAISVAVLAFVSIDLALKAH